MNARNSAPKTFEYNTLRVHANSLRVGAQREKRQQLIWMRLANADTSPTYKNTSRRAPRVAFWRHFRFRSAGAAEPLRVSRHPSNCMFARTAIILVLAFWPCAVQAQGVVRDDFEGPETVLKPAGGDAQHQVERHTRTADQVHSGRSSEYLRIVGNNGTAVYYSLPTRPARVISEYYAGVWLRSDRPGVQIAARVVLPRSRHPDSGEPLTTLVRGTDYKQVGSWQLLSVGNLPRALERQIPVLRSQFGPDVDPREAYVDLVLLNVYGGPGTTSVWVDDFETGGVVAAGNDAAAAVAAPSSRLPEPGAAQPPVEVPSVEYKRELLVGGQPFFPRIIEHRGEPLAQLQALGFNCVRMAELPRPDLLAEAARLGLWLIAPPPQVWQLASRDGGTGEVQISAAYDPVLAWDLGSGLSKRDLEPTRHWAEMVRRADPRDRPIVCNADSDLDNYTRPPFKVLLAERNTLGTSLELKEYADWLAERAQLARAFTPLWATIPTQPSPHLVEQMRLVSGLRVPVPVWQEAQIRALAHAALASRARGLCFTSETRLDAPDPATRARAAMLELLNLELQLIERWPAAGQFAAGATTSDRHTSGAVIETDRSRLMLPIYAPPGGQFVVGTQPAPLLSFKVAGVPEGDDAYELSLVGLRPLRSQRVTGGTEVVLGDYSRDSLVVFTQDPHVYRALKTTLARNARRAAQLARNLAAAQLGRHDVIAGRLAQLGHTVPTEQAARAQAAKELQQCDALLNVDFAKAYDHARHTLQLVRQIERVHWQQATRGPGRPLTNPLAASFETLPEHLRFLGEIAVAQRSGNRLSAGDCENLNAMLGAGWKHYLHEQGGVTTRVDLTPRAAHSGSAGLIMRAEPADAEHKPRAVETPPVWVTTAPVPLEAGDLVQIDAWVRIDKPITGSVDGLLVIDSLSGRALAMRQSDAKGWRQVTMYRAAARSGPVAVTFALAGLGEAAIDDVSIQIVHRAPIAARPNRP